MSTREKCAQPGTSSGAETTSCASAPSSSPTSRTPIPLSAGYNLPEIEKKIAYKANREGVIDHLPDPSVRKSIEVDLELLDFYDQLLTSLELYIVKKVKAHDVRSWYLLRSIPGVGKILSLVLLYEIHDIRRFPRVQDFVSYCRLVKCPRESAGKKFGTKNSKIGNVPLKWAFSPPGQPLSLSQRQQRPKTTTAVWSANTAQG
jgi:transposase